MERDETGVTSLKNNRKQVCGFAENSMDSKANIHANSFNDLWQKIIQNTKYCL